MGKKILILLLALALSLCMFSSAALAEELVNLQKIKERPVNVLEYADVGAILFANFLKTMNPLGMYNIKLKHGLSGVKLNLIEEFLHPKLNLIGGWTLKNQEPSHVLFGVELKLELKGDLGRAISKFKPLICWSNDKWWIGLSLTLRKMSIQ